MAVGQRRFSELSESPAQDASRDRPIAALREWCALAMSALCFIFRSMNLNNKWRRMSARRRAPDWVLAPIGVVVLILVVFLGLAAFLGGPEAAGAAVVSNEVVPVPACLDGARIPPCGQSVIEGPFKLVAVGHGRLGAAHNQAVAEIPRILWFRVSKHVVPSSGGLVSLWLRAVRSDRCWFSSSPGVVLARSVFGCRHGLVDLVARVDPWEGQHPERMWVRAWASDGESQTTSEVGLVAKGLSPLRASSSIPARLQLGQVVSIQLAASGGTPPYHWKILGGTLPVGMYLSATGLLIGDPAQPGSYGFSLEVVDSSRPIPLRSEVAAEVEVQGAMQQASGPAPLQIAAGSLPSGTLGASYEARIVASGGTPPYSFEVVSGDLPPGLVLASNGVISGLPSAAGDYGFRVEVLDSGSPPQTAYGNFSIVVASSTQLTTSANWSGYVATGSFTEATGVFQVPTLEAAPYPSAVSEWVGLGGVNSSSLIQAGVDETFQPSTGLFSVQAWWEILPAPSTPISMEVSPGDQVKVTIWDSGFGSPLWNIEVQDLTTGQSFETTQAWSADQTTADFVLEAPTNGSTGTEYPLAAFTAPVLFSDLGVGGSQSGLEEMVMVQGGRTVAEPSSFANDAFSVSYVGS